MLRLALLPSFCRLASLGSASRLAMSTTTTASESLHVEQFVCLQDNYGFLFHNEATGETAAIDTPEVGPIREACERRGWQLTHIWNTHHHHDHAGGNADLKLAYPDCIVLGPADEVAKIPTIDSPLRGGDTFDFGGHSVHVLDVGGHTLGHIAYHVPDAGVAFVGDSLFALGCGRLFEGTPQQAWASLQRLAALPEETAVYCAHEYTEANLRFSLTVDPGNPALVRRADDIRARRAKGEPTVPTTIGLELATNPFLRPRSETMRVHLGVPDGESDVETFARIRTMKDNA